MNASLQIHLKSGVLSKYFDMMEGRVRVAANKEGVVFLLSAAVVLYSWSNDLK